MRGGPGMDRGGITFLVYKSRHQVPFKWNVLLYCEFVLCLKVWEEEERGVVSLLAVALGVEWAGMVLQEATCRRELETGNVPIRE